MKRTNIFTAIGLTVIGTAMLFAIPAVAANEKMANVQVLTANLAKASSPENVKMVAQQQKGLYCAQNAKNKKLQGSKKEDYLAACMNKNEALLAYTAMNNQRFTSLDVNEKLRQAPTAAGNR